MEGAGDRDDISESEMRRKQYKPVSGAHLGELERPEQDVANGTE